MVEGLVTAVAFAVAFAMLLAGGARQRRESGGSARRLIFAAAAGAALVAAPLFVWTGLALARAGEGDPLAPCAGFAIALGMAATTSRWPAGMGGGRASLPLLEDEPFRARVAELAGGLGIAAPRVRVLGSVGAQLEALAWAGGLAAPSLVVADGILHRLAPAERDAIVAHELAHVSTGSLWAHAAFLPAAAVGAALASAWVGPIVALAFGAALYVGLRRVFGRPIEIACDLEAGRVAGHAKTAAALSKIHAAHPLKEEGVLPFLVYATTTHPPREMRLAALRRAAPEAERAAIAVDERIVALQRGGARAAFGAWAAGCAAALWAGANPARAGVAAGVLVALAALPTVLLFLALSRRRRRERRRLGNRSAFWRLAIAVGAITFAVHVLVDVSRPVPPSFIEDGIRVTIKTPEPRALRSIEEQILPIGAAIAFLVVAVLFLRNRGIPRLRLEVAAALRAREFGRALALLDAGARLVVKDPRLRHDRAIAKALTGDCAGALADLERLSLDAPRLRQTLLSRAVLTLEEDALRSLALAAEAAAALPDDPGPTLVAARAARRLGRLDEAEREVGRGLALEPQYGPLCATAAAIALDRGDLERARTLADDALLRAPGDAYALLARAEVALALEPPDAARAAGDAALAAVRANPFAFLQGDARALEIRLGRATAGAVATDPGLA